MQNQYLLHFRFFVGHIIQNTKAYEHWLFHTWEYRTLSCPGTFKFCETPDILNRHWSWSYPSKQLVLPGPHKPPSDKHSIMGPFILSTGLHLVLFEHSHRIFLKKSGFIIFIIKSFHIYQESHPCHYCNIPTPYKIITLKNNHRAFDLSHSYLCKPVSQSHFDLRFPDS